MVNKLNRIDSVFISAVLFAGIYLCFYNGLFFCGRLGAEGGEGISSEAAQGSGREAEGNWYVVKGANLIIYCEQTADLKSISDKLTRRSLFAAGVYDPNPTSAPSKKVAYRMKMLFKRAKEVLDMYPDIKDLKIKIFKNRSALDDEYARIFGTRQDYKSFYVHKLGTIYTSEEDISDSIIAHEMAHAIIDNYFAVAPPPKVAELLASYVDMHLEE